MAAENHNPENLLTIDGGNVSMSLARQRAAILASYEVEQLAIALREGISSDEFAFAAHGICMRVVDMSQVIMSAIGEEGIEVKSLYSTLGRDMPDMSNTEKALA